MKSLFELLAQGENPKEVGDLYIETNDEDKSCIVKIFVLYFVKLEATRV